MVLRHSLDGPEATPNSRDGFGGNFECSDETCTQVPFIWWYENNDHIIITPEQ